MSAGQTLPQWLQADYAALQEQLNSQHLAHALLFTAEAGTGKHVLINTLVETMLCEGAGQFACGQCASCKLLEAGTHPDLVELSPEEGKQEIVIDQIRSLMDFIYKTPQIASRKLVVIRPAEKMNRNAANALLKCLEEPPEASYFMLSSANPGRLPSTVRSRCQLRALSPPSIAQIEVWLARQNRSLDEFQPLLPLFQGRPYALLDEADAAGEIYQAVDGALTGLARRPSSVSDLARGMQSFAAIELLNMYQRLILEMVKECTEACGQLLSDGLRKAAGSWTAPQLLEHAAYAQNLLNRLHAGSHLNEQLMCEDLLLDLQARH